MIEAVIFADAVLPYPGRSWLQAAPSALARTLRARAVDGLAPPWTEWFGDNPISRLVGDVDLAAALSREAPPAPMAFLEASAPDANDWERLPKAYVQLSEAYAGEADEAERLGWTVTRARLHHLAMATDPVTVARILTDSVVCRRAE